MRRLGLCNAHLAAAAHETVLAVVYGVYLTPAPPLWRQPTSANIARLAADCARGMYETYYINFTPAVPRPILEELAQQTLESGAVRHVQ